MSVTNNDTDTSATIASLCKWEKWSMISKSRGCFAMAHLAAPSEPGTFCPSIGTEPPTYSNTLPPNSLPHKREGDMEKLKITDRNEAGETGCGGQLLLWALPCAVSSLGDCCSPCG